MLTKKYLFVNFNYITTILWRRIVLFSSSVAPKRVYVQLNDIFDLTSPSVLEERFNRAFGSNGNNMWDNFFQCGSVHPDDTIVYLFTEYQLKQLFALWKKKLAECKNDSEKKSLLYNKQEAFRSVEKKSNGAGLTDRIRACFINHPDFKKNVARVFFGKTPLNKKGYVNFFDGKFNGEPPGTTTDDMRRKKITNILVMRPNIEKEFKKNGPKRGDEKWLRYLSHELDIDTKAINHAVDYCECSGSNCKNVQFLRNLPLASAITAPEAQK